MSIRKIIALAAFTYLFLAPFTYHPDIKTIFYQSQFLTKGIFNIYAFFAENKEVAFSGPFVYPPLAYFIFGILFIPVRLLGGTGFVEWLGMGNDAIGVPHIFQYLFAIKLPAIAVHFATALIITRFFQGESSQRKALLVWFFNPVSIYVVAFMGQIDGIAVLLTVLALFYARKPAASSILLGLGGAFKMYPLLLIPFLAITSGKSWWSRFKYLTLGLLSYILLIIPFLNTPAFYSSTLVSGLSHRLFELRLSLGFGESLIIIPGIILILLFASLMKKYGDVQNLSFYFFAVTILAVVGTHFHPQWVLWSLPFLIISIIKASKSIREDVLLATILFFIGWLGTIVLFEDKFLTWGILSPFDPGTLFLPPPADLLRKFTDPLLLQSLFHTLMAASGIWLVMRSFRYEKSE